MTYRLTYTPDSIISRKALGDFETVEAAKAVIAEKGFKILFEEHDDDHPGCWDIAATKPGVAHITIGGKVRRIEGAQTLELFAIEKLED